MSRLHTSSRPLAHGHEGSLKNIRTFTISLANFPSCPRSLFPTYFLASGKWLVQGASWPKTTSLSQQRCPSGRFGSNFLISCSIEEPSEKSCYLASHQKVTNQRISRGCEAQGGPCLNFWNKDHQAPPRFGRGYVCQLWARGDVCQHMAKYKFPSIMRVKNT